MNRMRVNEIKRISLFFFFYIFLIATTRFLSSLFNLLNKAKQNTHTRKKIIIIIILKIKIHITNLLVRRYLLRISTHSKYNWQFFLSIEIVIIIINIIVIYTNKTLATKEQRKKHNYFVGYKKNCELKFLWHAEPFSALQPKQIGMQNQLNRDWFMLGVSYWLFRELLFFSLPLSLLLQYKMYVAESACAPKCLMDKSTKWIKQWLRENKKKNGKYDNT